MQQISALIDATAKEATDFRIELQNHLIDSIHKAVRDYGATSDDLFEVACIFLNNRWMSQRSREWFANAGIVFSKK